MAEGEEMVRKKWANAILYAAAVGVLLLPLGALGSRFGAWDF